MSRDGMSMELRKRLRNAQERVRILREKHSKFLAKIKNADGTYHRVSASDNEEWTKLSGELKEAEAQLRDATASMVAFHTGNR